MLVDVTPDELTARLAAGKVYLPQQAERAAQNFFRKGNLIALREIALRRTAEHVEDDVRGWRVEQSSSTGARRRCRPGTPRARSWRASGPQRGCGADGAHRRAPGGPAQRALACGVRRDAAAAAPARARGATASWRCWQAGRGTGRRHRGAHRRRRRAGHRRRRRSGSTAPPWSSGARRRASAGAAGGPGAAHRARPAAAGAFAGHRDGRRAGSSRRLPRAPLGARAR